MIHEEHHIGLTAKEAELRLSKFGRNELPSQKKRTFISLIYSVIREPMLLLLLVSGILYFFMGEVKDAIMLMSCIFFVIGITVYQERKTEKTLEALKNLSNPRALVIRDGKQSKIYSHEVVIDDLIVLREGDRVPADAIIISCENLSIDESLLTGESVPVRKSVWQDGISTKQRPGGDDIPTVFSGTMIVSGHGIAKVIATGSMTQMGSIGKSLESIKEEDTLLQKETSHIVRVIAVIGFILCIVVVFIYTFVKGNMMGGLLAGLTLSMAILPEEFPVVLVIFLTLGAWRISKRKVLTRKSVAIETLGAATVLCTDKTGTLTMNTMELTSLYSHGSYYELSNFASTPLPDTFRTLLQCGVLASQKDPFDPIEKELHKMEDLYVNDNYSTHTKWKLQKEYPLSKDLLALTHVWQTTDTKDFIVASKGAPEAILDLCHILPEEKKQIMQQVMDMSRRGLRVLAGAEATFSSSDFPTHQHDFAFTFTGLFGFIDPPRPNASQSIQEAYSAGVRVIMITGDYPGTAQYVAKHIGLHNPDAVITGEELEHMDSSTLKERIKTINVFARIMPEQKLLLVNALKANHEIVAMTGDGVNDAPALKAAHIGIAMGERGTDVAREASALVLLNDDFSSIISAIRLGRRIYNNLQKAMSYIVAVHVPIAGLSLLPLLFNLPPVLFPAHIAFLELIIDPTSSTVFESEEEDADIMNIPPRNLHAPLFTRQILMTHLLQGLGVLIVCFGLYWYIIQSGKGELEARSYTYATLIFANIFLVVTNLSWKQTIFQTLRNPPMSLIIISLMTLFSLFAILYIPFFAELFSMTPLFGDDFLLIGIVVLLCYIWFEGLEFLNRKYSKIFFRS